MRFCLIVMTFMCAGMLIGLHGGHKIIEENYEPKMYACFQELGKTSAEYQILLGDASMIMNAYMEGIFKHNKLVADAYKGKLCFRNT